MAALISFLTLVLTVIWGVVRYYHSLSYKRESLQKQIREWEERLGKELYKGNASGITLANAELKRLRKAYAALPDR